MKIQFADNLSQLKFPRGKRDDRSRLRLAIEMNADEKRAIRGEKGRNVRFGTTLPPAIVSYPGGAAAADRQWPRDLRTPKNTPNRSLVTHIITNMSHTSAIERIFNA